MEFDKFENKHIGERCFILGCAPSLRDEDLSLLKDETVFICNRAYKSIEMLGLPSYDYYVLTDPTVYLDIGRDKEFSSIATPRFYSDGVGNCIRQGGCKADFVEQKKMNG